MTAVSTKICIIFFKNQIEKIMLKNKSEVYWLITTSLHWSWNRSYNSPEKKQTKLANPCLFQKLYVFGHTKTQRWPKSSVAHRIHHYNLPFLNIMTIILFRSHWRLSSVSTRGAQWGPRIWISGYYYAPTLTVMMQILVSAWNGCLHRIAFLRR